MRSINQLGLDLIKSFEGCKLATYKDSVGMPTIGYGHTGPEVKMGMTITQQKADEYLKLDLQKFCSGVESAVKVPVNDNQFAALVCFSYNVGLGNLKASTLLKKVNAKDFDTASKEFLKWNRAGGQVVAGLTRRRKAESDLFKSPDQKHTS